MPLATVLLFFERIQLEIIYQTIRCLYLLYIVLTNLITQFIITFGISYYIYKWLYFRLFQLNTSMSIT